MQRLKEICGNCGCTYGAHCASEYYSKEYERIIPRNYCPSREGRIDWDKGPGTTFKSTGIYKEEEEKKDDK